MGMTIKELSSALNHMNIPKDSYSIMTGGFPNERLCIIKEDKWQIYYSEHGRKSGLKTFENEEDACEYFFYMILKMYNKTLD